jgi:hypothetical protein
MIIQEATTESREAVWISVVNRAGSTLQRYQDVYKFTALGNAASIGTNEAATQAVAGAPTGFLGLADEDIPDNESGLVLCYGYSPHFIAGLAIAGSSLTIPPGTPLGPHGTAASVGLCSAGYGHTLEDLIGPVVALETVGLFSLSLGTATHMGGGCFVRAM